METIQGTLIRIDQMGVLLIGVSGIGKSETALSLVESGHQLVADDLVSCFKRGGFLLGKAPPPLLGKIHIRDLGVLDISNLFGSNALCDQSNIDLAIELKVTTDTLPSDNLLLPNQQTFEILGTSIPRIFLQYAPNRPLPLLVKAAARQFQPGLARIGLAS